MTQKNFVFRQLSSYTCIHVCTRRIQFLPQNFHVVSFAYHDDVGGPFVGRDKDIFTT